MIGIDIEKIKRFDHWTREGYQRIFTEKEIEYAYLYENYLERFCGFFCVKEAFVKAVDDTSIHYSQIEILHTETGKPYINRTPYIESILKEHHANILEISISHNSDTACAIVLVQ